MPLLTNLIDDKSPLIAYDATWLAGTSQDSFATDYYLSTFTVNSVTDGVVEFNFNGTAVWVYGANRPNHGSYTVQVDGETFPTFNGSANNLFQQTIFNVSSLDQGMHSLTLTNTASGRLYVDIDMTQIVWQSQVGGADDDGQLIVEVVQDTDPRFQYQEPAWATTSSAFNLNLFSNGTGHVTKTYEASVTFKFTGMLVVQYTSSRFSHFISLFGTSGPNNGPYSTQLDGGSTTQYNATNADPNYYGVMIYHADNLGPGFHELVLTNLPVANGQSLSIDYAQLWTVSSANSTPTTLPNTSLDYTQNSKLDSGTITGIVVVTVVAILSAGVAFVFYRRWSTAMAAQRDLYRAYVTQQRPPSSATAVPTPTGFSSSLDTRSNDASNRVVFGSARQTANNYDGLFPAIYPPSPSPQSVADEGLESYPLLEVSRDDPANELSRTVWQHNMLAVNHGAVSASNAPPPNYTQAIRNVRTTHA